MVERVPLNETGLKEKWERILNWEQTAMFLYVSKSAFVPNEGTFEGYLEVDKDVGGQVANCISSHRVFEPLHRLIDLSCREQVAQAGCFMRQTFQTKHL